MTQVLIIIATALISFYLGYQFCMVRNIVKKTKELLKLTTAALSRTMSTEEIMKQLKKLEI